MNAFSARLAAFVGFVAVGTAALAKPPEDYASQFKAAFDAKNYPLCEKILKAWGKTEPNDPSYYITGANFYYTLANSIHITTKPASKGDFVLVDPKTNKAAGSMSGGPARSLGAKASALLKTANAKFPNRLDIWLGRATLYEAFDQPKELVAVLRELAAYVNANPAGLLGLEGRPFPEPVRKNVAQKIGGFAGRNFDLRTKEGDQQFFAIASLTAEAFPDTVYGHNMLGNYYAVINPNPPRAIDEYRKALAIDPADSLVWCNLGETYLLAEQYEESRKVIGKVLELNNDPASVEHAKKLQEKLPPK